MASQVAPEPQESEEKNSKLRFDRYGFIVHDINDQDEDSDFRCHDYG